MAWGNNWVVAAISVKLPFMQRTVCLPVLMALWQPRRKAFAKANKPDPERPSKVMLAAGILQLIAVRYPDRTVHAVGDAAYASGTLAVSAAVTVTSRLIVNASLHAPEPPKTGKRGQPAKKGARLGSLTQITADPATVWTTVTATRYGKTEQLLVGRIPWPPSEGAVCTRRRTRPGAAARPASRDFVERPQVASGGQGTVVEMDEDYAAASLARRSDVRALVDARRELAALYMIGYVAECCLKALLKTRKRPFPRSGGQGHDLRALWQGAGFKLRDAGDDGASFLTEWTTSLRYQATVPSRLDHERLMKGANAACDFVTRRHRAEALDVKRRNRRGVN